MQWTYLDDYGGQHRVGLFHGKNTGHLMIYINGRVVVIDFNVLQSKSYSFLIEDELCDLHVKNTNGKFAYDLAIDRKANTPGNIRRRKRERRDTIGSVIFGVCFLSLIIITVFFVLGGKGYF